MAEYTNEQLIEMYHKLPKDVQEAIISVDTAEAIRAIGEKHKLMIDKIGELADETGLVMLGITQAGQYVPHLIERLEVSQEIAQEITEEINTKILFPIRDSLRKIQEEREATAEFPEPIKPEIPVSEKPSPPPPASLAGEPPIMPSIPETATLVSSLPSPLAETPPPAPSFGGLPIATPSTEGEPAIFQAKTKEEIFRQPLSVTENPPVSGEKKFDPYKEPTT